MTEHELPEPRQTLVYDVWSVFKHYDAMAPDTDNVVWCATEELAEEVAQFLADHEDDNPIVLDGEEYYFPKPYVNGFEHCSSYEICRATVTQANKDRIGTTLQKAVSIASE